MDKTNFEHALSEAVLKEAAKEYETEICLEAKEDFGKEEFEFSPEHEEKMKKMFTKKKKDPWRVLKWAASIAAAFAVCFTAAMQVEAFATPVKDALFGYPTVTKSEQRSFDVYHPYYLGPPISSFSANIAFEFNGQSAKIISCTVDGYNGEEAAVEVEYVVSGDAVVISYVCSDTRDMETIRAENPTTEYMEGFTKWVGVELVKETLTLRVLPDGNIDGFV